MAEKWYEKSGDCGDVVISSRVRLARNLRRYPFPNRASAQQKSEIEQKIREALLSTGNAAAGSFQYIALDSLSEEAAVSLAERHLVSPEFLSDRQGRAVLVSEDESVSIMINEEDHLRIQVMHEGLSLIKAAELADRLDTLLNETLDFAFDKEFGYLTQCPTNLGTGMRASVMLHLPALTESGTLGRIAGNLSKLGLTLRGSFGEGSRVMGSLYQLSNQITLGLTETQAIENLTAIVNQLVSEERKLRHDALESLNVQDKISRAAGVLKSARLLPTSEFMELWSQLRLGVTGGVVSGISTADLNRLMTLVQPATLMHLQNRQMTEQERDALRAAQVRMALVAVKE